MDEATASVDFATDEAIQVAIRSEFKESTLLTIAHRLSSVIDYDRLLVLADGTVAEFDTPMVSRCSWNVSDGGVTDAARDAGQESLGQSVRALRLPYTFRSSISADTLANISEPAPQGDITVQEPLREVWQVQGALPGGGEEGERERALCTQRQW